jgi:hypothetical protein
MLMLSSCGGGGDDHPTAPASGGNANTPASGTAALGANVVAVTVTGGPSNNINLPMTSITVCAPASNNCQTIDNVLVDTGSSGVRLFSAALSVALPQQTLADGTALSECTPFADGSTWGPVKLADVHIAGEAAGNIPVQVVGDPSFSTIPTACSNTGPTLDTPNLFGANGVLGIGVFKQDCGMACARSVGHGIYFGCTSSACNTVAAPIEQQVQNPISFFAGDNNGSVLNLPAVPPDGAAAATGTLTFGIGTQTNNALNGATVFTVTPDTGFFTTTYNGASLRRSFIDSGSNGLFFNDSSIPVCNSGFYCPTATLTLSAVNTGTNGAQRTINFSVANADTVINANASHRAFNNLAGSAIGTEMFDWGLPFFLGRQVFTAIEDSNTPGGTGPYFAY